MSFERTTKLGIVGVISDEGLIRKVVFSGITIVCSKRGILAVSENVNKSGRILVAGVTDNQISFGEIGSHDASENRYVAPLKVTPTPLPTKILPVSYVPSFFVRTL